MSPKSVTMEVRAADIPEVRGLVAVLMAEHKALHAYFVARLLLVDADNEHKAYSDVIVAHDDVADHVSRLSDDISPRDPGE